MSNGDLSLGRELRIESGLVEITYGTGATVLLQGPVAYEVESANCGFLSLGKLTGKVEARQAKGFVVRTPTATVTDLGTEFGVEVDEQGTTLSHVFRGSVKLETDATRDGGEKDVHILKANESAQVKRADGGQETEIRSIQINPASFVRVQQLPKMAEEARLTPIRRWQAYSHKLRRDPSLLVYYDFQQKKGEPGRAAQCGQQPRPCARWRG